MADPIRRRQLRTKALKYPKNQLVLGADMQPLTIKATKAKSRVALAEEPTKAQVQCSHNVAHQPAELQSSGVWKIGESSAPGNVNASSMSQTQLASIVFSTSAGMRSTSQRSIDCQQGSGPLYGQFDDVVDSGFLGLDQDTLGSWSPLTTSLLDNEIFGTRRTKDSGFLSPTALSAWGLLSQDLAHTWDSAAQNMNIMPHIQGSQTLLSEEQERLLSSLPDLVQEMRALITERHGLLEQRDTIRYSTEQRFETFLTEFALRDSAAVKTITTVTVLFVPATFVSSVFGMYGVSHSTIYGARPLAPLVWDLLVATMATSVLWFGWWTIRTRRRRDDDMETIYVERTRFQASCTTSSKGPGSEYRCQR